MKQKWIDMYMDIAERLSIESHAIRAKVGAIYVTPTGIISVGINGLKPNGSNICEDATYKTLPQVIHAEENCFSKMLDHGISSKNGTIFITHQPCYICSRLILNGGTTSVYYRNDYGDNRGIDLLTSNGVTVQKV